MFDAYFEIFTQCLVEDSLKTLKIHSSILYYQLLPLATNHLVGDNRKFIALGMLLGILLIMDR